MSLVMRKQTWRCVGMVVVNAQWLLLKITFDTSLGTVQSQLIVDILAREFTSLSS